MTLNIPVKFSQWDSRWGQIPLGNNTDLKYSIYNDGCLLNDIAAIAKYYGFDTDPARLNQALKDNGGFPNGSGEYVWGSVTRIFSSISENRTVTPDLLTDAQMGEIKSAIDSGFPVVIEIDYNPKTSNLETHFVTIIAYDPNDENNFTIYDPLGGTVHSLKDYLGWFRPSARKDVEQYVVFKGNVPANASDDTMVLKSSLYPPLVHNSTEWGKVVNKYLGPGIDPNQSSFEQIQSVVSGYQSMATTANKRADSMASDLATAQQEASNSQEKLDIEVKQHGEDVDLLQKKIDALMPNQKQIDAVTAQYDGQIAQLKDQMAVLLEDKHQLSIQLAQAQAKQPEPSVNLLISTLLALLKLK